jgi:uncharacterized protein (TIGR04255 family)
LQALLGANIGDMQISLATNKQLPTKLGREPLVDAVLEIRFTSLIPASSVLPGILFSGLDGDKTIERLPAADIPLALRGIDPNIQFAPVGRVVWDNFFILYSDNSLAIACKVPYSGWQAFKIAIERVLKLVAKEKIITNVNRIGLKYVDLVEKSTLQEQVGAVNLALTIANHQLTEEQFQLRLELTKKGFINAIQLIAGATISINNSDKRSGLIVDIDTIKNTVDLEMSSFMNSLSTTIEEMHTVNKEVFFDILTQSTINSLEPQYDTMVK